MATVLHRFVPIIGQLARTAPRVAGCGVACSLSRRWQSTPAANAPVDDSWRKQVPLIANHLDKAKSVLVVTGAGMSADSGLPTYRGVGGLYEGKETEEGLDITEALSATIMQTKPHLTWKYLLQVERACRDKRPNRGHVIIRDMEEHFDRLLVLTQNIDGLHHDAGSSNVIDIHGDIKRLRCTQCSHHEHVRDYSHVGPNLPPLCLYCGGVVRPEVILFEESLEQPKLDKLWAETLQGFDVVFSIGTSALFDYIIDPVLYSRGTTIEINPGTTELTPNVDFHVKAGAKEALEAIWDEFIEIRRKKGKIV
eukprot:comp12033_c0_seq1/m.6728 comp12033_c0_seq1/g.6728  ORF comp12033_c0_seq1/g.6728 comp12033_c0_seq1/m.6728 type:complete len:309 (-) comp12033_c0_seq1:15-941(-)